MTQDIEGDAALSLLRRFEPVVRFTRGERFFPMNVDPYVRASSLWVQRPGETPVCLAPQGELTLDRLSEPLPDSNEGVYFLRFIEPFDLMRLLAHLGKARRQDDPRKKFRVGLGRLARVGYSSRFADLIFSLTLLLRGRVPGDASAAAVVEYERIQTEEEGYQYQGRVIRRQGWVVLQYWLFYAFNNWRSAFYGINDHEADWELVTIYLYETAEGEYVPEWVACSAHEFFGDDLRRRWDDDELEKIGEHPVIYVGAGSHACYYLPGEYQAELDLPFSSPMRRSTLWLRGAWRRLMGSGEGMAEPAHSAWGSFRVPFVDFARGDGLAIGPGQDVKWDAPRLLDPAPGWLSYYHGLWGMYVQDPVAGENAPAGPLYNRDGSLRLSWYDPLGWAGMDKVTPPNLLSERLRLERAELNERQEHLQDEIAKMSAELTGLGLTSSAIRHLSHLNSLEQAQSQRLTELSIALDRLYEESARTSQLLEAIDWREKRLLASEREPAQAHLRRKHRPASQEDLRSSRSAELWAAASIGLMMIAFVGVILFLRHHIVFGLVALISTFVFIESGFRKQLPQVINSVAIGLAIVTALILVFRFFWIMVILGVFFAGIYILWENLRELARR